MPHAAMLPGGQGGDGGSAGDGGGAFTQQMQRSPYVPMEVQSPVFVPAELNLSEPCSK